MEDGLEFEKKWIRGLGVMIKIIIFYLRVLFFIIVL